MNKWNQPCVTLVIKSTINTTINQSNAYTMNHWNDRLFLFDASTSINQVLKLISSANLQVHWSFPYLNIRDPVEQLEQQPSLLLMHFLRLNQHRVPDIHRRRLPSKHSHQPIRQQSPDPVGHLHKDPVVFHVIHHGHYFPPYMVIADGRGDVVKSGGLDKRRLQRQDQGRHLENHRFPDDLAQFEVVQAIDAVVGVVAQVEKGDETGRLWRQHANVQTAWGDFRDATFFHWNQFRRFLRRKETKFHHLQIKISEYATPDLTKVDWLIDQLVDQSHFLRGWLTD